MIKRVLFYLLIFIINSQILFGQQADFTTNPPNNGSVLNICSNSTVLFQLNNSVSVIGNNSNTVVSWTITTTSGSNSASITSTSLRTEFPITFPTGSYTVLLTVSIPNTLPLTKSLNVIASNTTNSLPNISLNSANSSNWSTSSINIEGNSVTTFTSCPQTISNSHYIKWDLNNITCSNVNNISISDYSQPSPIDCSMGEIENTYDALNVRFFYLVLKVDFTNGCTFSDVYFVQIGQPSIPLESATTPACDPGNYSLSFTNQYPGVSYNIDWDLNDANNPLETYSYPNLPIKPSKVSHIYPFLGCSIGTSQPYQIQVSATNTCGTSTNPAANIYVSEAPEAIFSRSPDLDTICQGTTVTYTNNSISGNYVYPNSGICTQDYNFWWYHSNNTGSGPSVLPNSPNVISPSTITSLGTQLTNGPQTFTVTYNQPGTYTIKLFVKNPACGQDVMEKTVIVLPKAFIPDSTYSI
ncbi:MAG: hypothetical protein NWS43_03740, partial [Crocinitomicaceae bacterium]|nr:hypothetical protein [Crocinitomicaceae bacterium]